MVADTQQSSAHAAHFTSAVCIIGRLPDYTRWKKLPSPCLANRGFSFGNFGVRACRMPTFPGGAAMRRLSTFLTPSQQLQLPLVWEWDSHLATCPISLVHLTRLRWGPAPAQRRLDSGRQCCREEERGTWSPATCQRLLRSLQLGSTTKAR